MDKMAKARMGAKLSVHLDWERVYDDFCSSGLSIYAFHQRLVKTGAEKYSRAELHGYVPAANTMSRRFQKMRNGASDPRHGNRQVQVIELAESSFGQELRMSSGGVEISFSCDDPARAAAEVLHHLKALEDEAE